MSHRFMYIRNTKQQPVGVLAISLNKDTKKIEYQFSTVNSTKAVVKDGKVKVDTFDSIIGKEMAQGRLKKYGVTLPLQDDDNAHSITAKVMQDIIVSRESSSSSLVVPSKVSKFAKRWLRAYKVKNSSK